MGGGGSKFVDCEKCQGKGVAPADPFDKGGDSLKECPACEGMSKVCKKGESIHARVRSQLSVQISVVIHSRAPLTPRLLRNFL
jgi:DnaJ-class molecular chaperone